MVGLILAGSHADLYGKIFVFIIAGGLSPANLSTTIVMATLKALVTMYLWRTTTVTRSTDTTAITSLLGAFRSRHLNDRKCLIGCRYGLNEAVIDDSVSTHVSPRWVDYEL